MSKPAHRNNRQQRGAVLVLAALLLIVLLGFAALAVDVGHLTVVKNELQNAADAGALAGASRLYLDDGQLNQTAAQDAESTAERNNSVKTAVEVTLSGNSADSDVQIGHWSLSGRTFTRFTGSLASYVPINIAAYSDEELDNMNDTSDPSKFLINAVLVRTHREDTPAPSFFAKVLNFSGFGMTSEAVAYLGYSGYFEPGDLDWPITVCEESILDSNGNYSCGQGRLINSSDNDSKNTGAWTNYSVGCTNNFNASDLSQIFSYQNKNNQDCDGSNENIIDGPISVGGGQVGGSFRDMAECAGFDASVGPIRDTSWKITVPVVDCDGVPGVRTPSFTQGNINGCKTITGAVTLEVVLITNEFPASDQQPDKKYQSIPPTMTAGGKVFTYDNSVSGQQNWLNFVDKFGLQVNGQPATTQSDLGFYQKTVYALPSCEPQPPRGSTGGIKTGSLSEHPVLVKGSYNY